MFFKTKVQASIRGIHQITRIEIQEVWRTSSSVFMGKDKDLQLLFFGANLDIMLQVAKCGFTASKKRDPLFSDLEVFGDGYYLSRCASKAHHYTQGSHFMIIAYGKVDPAGVWRSTNENAENLGSPFVCPGRHLPTSLSSLVGGKYAGSVYGTFNEEYVFTDSEYVWPKYLIRYQAVS